MNGIQFLHAPTETLADDNDVPRSVVETLVQTTRAGTAPLQRYAKLPVKAHPKGLDALLPAVWNANRAREQHARYLKGFKPGR